MLTNKYLKSKQYKIGNILSFIKTKKYNKALLLSLNVKIIKRKYEQYTNFMGR